MKELARLGADDFIIRNADKVGQRFVALHDAACRVHDKDRVCCGIECRAPLLRIGEQDFLGQVPFIA